MPKLSSTDNRALPVIFAGLNLLLIEDVGSTSINIKVDGEEIYQRRTIEVLLEGDAEAETFTQALEFAAHVLRKQLNRRHRLG
jgi:hypothetical protein